MTTLLNLGENTGYRQIRGPNYSSKTNQLLSPNWLFAPCLLLICIDHIPEYILGVDVSQDLDLTTTTGEFCLHIRVVKPMLVGHVK